MSTFFFTRDSLSARECTEVSTSMREVVSVHVGQCGALVGSALWVRSCTPS